MYGLQYGVLAHTEQQAIKDPKITSVKPFKRENQRSYLFENEKRETRINYINKQELLNIRFLCSVNRKNMLTSQNIYAFSQHEFI